MSDQEQRPNKGIQDATTGEMVIVPVSDEEWDEIKAKQARVRAEQEAQAAAEAAAQAQAETDQAVIDVRPSDDEISSATNIADLKDMMLRQNAVIDLLLRKQGLVS